MSIEIDPREVLEHLEYLGYSSITKEQLKDFIRDLKKLIKYEHYKESRVQPIEQEVLDKVSVACETSLPFDNPDVNIRCTLPSVPLDNIEHYSNHVQCSPQTKTGTVTPSLQKSYHSEDYDLPTKQEDNVCLTCCKHSDEKHDVKSCVRKDCCEAEKQPCPSFIRPGMGKPAKCDPVALYHYYQNQWSKRPLPGEDPRTDLRWAVRTRLAQQKQQPQAFLGKTSSMDGVHRRKVQT